MELNQTYKGDWYSFWKIFKRIFIRPLFYIIPLFLVLVIRLIKPIVFIRFGVIDIGRIGGIYQGEWYLSEKANSKNSGSHIDFFFINKSTAHVNNQWARMWKRVLPHFPGFQLWIYMKRLNRLFPGYKCHEIPSHSVYPDLKTWQEHLMNPDLGKIDIFNKRLNAVLNQKTSNISFNEKEILQGQSVLNDLGILNNNPYICFHNRDSAYLNNVYKKPYDWSYHNYRDSNINNYLPMADIMAKRGYYVLRMGAIIKDSISSTNPKIIDYASNGKRTDFNDIYIGGHCKYFLCSDVGISAIPEIFRVPSVYVNWTQIRSISTWVLNGLFIFKKFYHKEEDRLMTFSELLNLSFGGNNTNEIISNAGLELIENRPDEISSVAIEMDERLNGTWKPNKNDEELQNRFWALFGPNKIKSPNLRIGAEFLRQNQELLN